MALTWSVQTTNGKEKGQCSLSLNYICTSHNKKKRKKKKNYIYALNEGDGVSILTIGQLTKVANLGCVGWTFAL